jgi:putative photosynthetic complex assembly protein
MSTDRKQPPFPRAPLIGAAAVISFSLACAIIGRVSGEGAWQPKSTVVSQRSLRFEDAANGAVLVYDAGRNPTDAGATPIAVETGENGFLRGTLRGFARTRMLDHVGDMAPFRLTAWADGRLTLEDPSTGRHADLEAFGETNVAVFGRFLIPPARFAANATHQAVATP